MSLNEHCCQVPEVWKYIFSDIKDIALHVGLMFNTVPSKLAILCLCNLQILI